MQQGNPTPYKVNIETRIRQHLSLEKPVARFDLWRGMNALSRASAFTRIWSVTPCDNFAQVEIFELCRDIRMMTAYEHSLPEWRNVTANRRSTAQPFPAVRSVPQHREETRVIVAVCDFRSSIYNIILYHIKLNVYIYNITAKSCVRLKMMLWIDCVGSIFLILPQQLISLIHALYSRVKSCTNHYSNRLWLMRHRDQAVGALGVNTVIFISHHCPTICLIKDTIRYSKKYDL